MLTDFNLDPSIFEADLLNNESICVLHDTILDYWNRYGILITKQGSGEAYLASIKKLPPKFHQRWIQAFSDYSSAQSPANWNDCSLYTCFDKAISLSDFFRTAVTEDTVSAVICDNEKTTRYCEKNDFEVVGVGSITESIRFRESKDSSMSDIAYKTQIGNIWKEKFQKLAQFNKTIFISDRYVFSSILRDLQNGHRASIAKFIEMLPPSKKFSITILSDGGPRASQTHVEIINYFEKSILRSPPLAQRLANLKLISMTTDDFKRFSHDRYIRFGRHVCQIGVGMAIFEHPNVPATTFSIKIRHESTANEIERLALSNLWHETLSP